MLHVAAFQEPSLYSLEEWHWAPFAGFRRVQFRKHDVKNKKAQCSKVPTEVQTDVRTQLATGVESVRAALEEAEKPKKSSNQGSKATSSDQRELTINALK